jgi:hypothetical protein
MADAMENSGKVVDKLRMFIPRALGSNSETLDVWKAQSLNFLLEMLCRMSDQ